MVEPVGPRECAASCRLNERGHCWAFEVSGSRALANGAGIVGNRRRMRDRTRSPTRRWPEIGRRDRDPDAATLRHHLCEHAARGQLSGGTCRRRGDLCGQSRPGSLSGLPGRQGRQDLHHVQASHDVHAFRGFGQRCDGGGRFPRVPPGTMAATPQDRRIAPDVEHPTGRHDHRRSTAEGPQDRGWVLHRSA